MSTRASFAGLPSVLVVALLAGCAPSARTLSVDVQTDLLPGVELGSLTIELYDGSLPRGAGTTRSRAVTTSPTIAEADAYRRGRRVTEYGELAPGTYTVRAVARRPAAPGLSPDTGALLVERRVVALLEDDRVVRVVLLGECVGVSCPGTGDAAELSQCLNGRCTDPRCDPSRPEASTLCCTGPTCGASALCAASEDCAAPACAVASCIDGACVAIARPGACGMGEYCDLGEGACLPLPDATPRDAGAADATMPDLSDAGPPDPLLPDAAACPAEVCGNGGDEDCDGLADCTDPDCTGTGCDDGDLCTHSDACTGTAAGCRGTTVSCASSDCTTRACNGTASCTETPRSGACTDDGNDCTDDVCAGGACTHPARGGPGPIFCTDDGNPCSFDLCDAGVCTHPRGFDGWACGAGGRCCNNTCVDVSSDPGNCGVCGITCPRACVAGACECGPGYECVDAGYGPLGTCFDPGDGLGRRCQCRCTGTETDRLTCAGQCSGGATCNQVTGLNYCFYP